MGIQTELTRISNAKSAIKAAIEGKGVTVPDGTLLDGMGALIGSIEAGGGGVDTSQDTVTASVLAAGYTAHNAAGELIQGSAYPEQIGIASLVQNGGSISISNTYKHCDLMIAFHVETSTFLYAYRKKARESTWVLLTCSSSAIGDYTYDWDGESPLLWAVSPDITIPDNTVWECVFFRIWR